MPMAPSKLDRGDLRRSHRRMAPIFDVIVECELFRSLDWSIGGIHLDGVCEGVPVGGAVEGWIVLPGASCGLAFSGEILRIDTATGNTVVRFDDIEPEAANLLDLAVARRLH